MRGARDWYFAMKSIGRTITEGKHGTRGRCPTAEGVTCGGSPHPFSYAASLFLF